MIRVKKTIRLSFELNCKLKLMQLNKINKFTSVNALIIDILESAVLNDNSRYIIEDTTRRVVKEETEIIVKKIDTISDALTEDYDHEN